jgi:hypothetical protein
MELLERASQLAELRQHLRSAAAGQGRLVLIAGEAGAAMIRVSLIRGEYRLDLRGTHTLHIRAVTAPPA